MHSDDPAPIQAGRQLSPIDVLVSSRVKMRREELKLTQAAMAEFLDVSLTQFQKYETAKNRISAGTLYRMAIKLRVPVDWFFEF